MGSAVPGRGKARQNLIRPPPGGEGRPMDHAVQIRQDNRLQLLRAENMHILRPSPEGVRADGRIGVVVARSDEHRAGQRRQDIPQLLQGLRENPLPVKEVPGQQQHLRLLLQDQPGQTAGQLPALPAALPCLLGGQAAKGAVQMKVCGMYDLRHRSLPSPFPARPHGIPRTPPAYPR